MKRALLIVFLFVLAGVACRSKSDGSPAMASVNGREVTRAVFDRFLALKLGEFATNEMSDALRSQIFDEYLLRQVVLEEASRTGLTITDTEVEKLTQDNPQMRSTTSDTEGRKELENDLLIEKYYQQKILRETRLSPEAIDQYIEANKDRLTNKPGFYVREIRVPSKEEAEAIRREIVEGKNDFAKVARTHSTSLKTEQGELTRYDEGQMPTVLEQTIKSLAPGSVSQVVQSNYGFQVI